MIETGVLYVAENLAIKAGSLNDPIAAIPLVSRDVCVGAIAVVSFLEQKHRWADVDHELLRLLGSHAATALIAANQYSSTNNPRKALAGIADNLAVAN